jgi:Tfp pilus assembly protein PilE
MGQQQLLLVILVTIIVGIATVVAINTFGSSATNANRDAVRQDIAAIATSAQAWYIKPTMLEGGGNTFTGLNFNNVNFPSETVSADGLTATNLNGSYVIAIVGPQEFTVTATPTSNTAADGVTITGTITPSNVALVTAVIAAAE